MKKVFSLITNFNEIFLIDEEVKIFDNIDSKILKSFKNIVSKLNNRKIKFKIIKKTKALKQPFTISLIDNSFPIFYPLDYNNIWSNFSFFNDYLEYENYSYNKNAFIQLHLKLKRYNKLVKINSLISFSPFFIEKLFHKKNKFNFLLKYIPKFKVKDSSFYNKVHFMGYYGHYFLKSSNINNKFLYVVSKLADDESKKDLKTLIYGDAEKSWKNYFNKSHHICQYNDYLTIDKNSVVINCGVEIGTELKIFNGADIIYNIDPGGDQYLDESVKYLMKKSSTKNVFLDYALYSSDGIYTDNEKNKKTKVSTLKKIIDLQKLERVDLVKSDIEGAERYMCEDLINICLKYNSQLAISIYHTNHKRDYNEKLYDLVDIPFRLIEKLENKYNFYIKHYCYERWEAIFYAIPKTKKQL